MVKQKSFWKKYEFLIITALTLLAIYLFIFFNQKVNYLLGNQLIIYLTPHQKSLSLHYGEKSSVEFDVSIDNAAYCKASCSYTFNDRSANEVIEKGDFIIEKGQHLTKIYEFGVRRLGSGQDLYSFESKCRSMRSFFCLTKGYETSRSSIIAVNYDLTETERALKNLLKHNITQLLESLDDANTIHQQVNQEYFELAHKINLNNLTKSKIEIDDTFDKLRISIENLRSLWSTENYFKLDQLFNESYFENLSNAKNSITDLNRSINNIAGLHNDLLANLESLSGQLMELSSFANILNIDNVSYGVNINAKKFTNLASAITSNSFENYSILVESADNIANDQAIIIEKSKIPAGVLFFNSEYFLNMERQLLCRLQQNCSGNISIISLAEDTEGFIESYPNSSILIQSCNNLGEMNKTYFYIRNKAIELIKNKSIAFPNDDAFLEFANYFNDNILIEINNSNADSYEKMFLENNISKDGINIINSTLPKYKTSYKELNYNESTNISLYLLSKINISEEAAALLSKCSKLEASKETINFSFEPVNLSLIYKPLFRIDTSLPDNPPICCVLNDCKPCCNNETCKNDPRTFPIILLHGHSLAKGNSPEFSLDSFNKLQEKLQDDGYLSAGTISLYSKNEPFQQGIWGLSGKPVTVKVSYYYDAFRKDDKYIVVPTKSENIDTYSLRLKDLIEIIKERTGKPKVNIIAHSMGGLVARKYIQVFDDEDVDKLVMISTPNKGISGAISDYCGFVGENRECQDMQENSLFLNKLNDESNQPKNAKIYAIVGQGCKMKAGDGDGVVLTENEKLENARIYYVNGSCGGLFGETLHTEVLDIERYPETYKIVKDILKE